MNKKFTRLLALLSAVIMIAGLSLPASAATSTSDLGKLLDTYSSKDETFTISGNSRFFIVSTAEPTGELLQTVQLARKQFAEDGYDLKIVWGEESWAAAGDIAVILDAQCGLADDGYKLDVGSTAKVTASNVDGLLYGLNMLQKHIRNGGATLQGFTAQDQPDTVQRAVSLDCGRKYYTKNWICNFIRQMSWMGYNTLELHFSDDSGFRMDFWDSDYYKGDFQPANDFSWVCGSNYTSWTLAAYQNDADKGKYLTTAEVVEILETAKEYHIDVIPAFDSPSHLDYMTWKYEQNYKSDNNYSFESTYDNTTYYAKDVKGIINYTNSSGWSTPLQWPYYSAVNIKGEQAKAFIFELYIDIANFFKEYAGSTDFSIGADEVQLNTANLASGYSYAWGFGDFVSYINELNTMLNDKGYTIRMYNDFIGSTSYDASSYDFADNIEILYWDSPFNPSFSTDTNHTQPASYYANKGMTLYNCIQTHTYYALRITEDGSDARSELNRQWTFYHSTEKSIYDEWTPDNFREIGVYTEADQIVSGEYLGGAYFLIWGDYACVSTEAEIWNGVYDKTVKKTGEFYSLLDRMWSNTIKMWNWDINNTVTYDSYAALRAKFGYFPGFTACSTATDLTDDVSLAQAYLADHSALTAALAHKVSSAPYTAESYAEYEAAYQAAETLNADHGASAKEMADAIAALETAKSNLELAPMTVTVQYKTTVNGQEKTIKTESFTRNVTSYTYYVAPVNGYTYKSCSGASFTPNRSGDGSGYISGILNSNITVTIWYENTPNTGRLSYLVQNGILTQGSYSDASWEAYESALRAASNFVVGNTTTQTDIDKLVLALEKAQSGLAVSSSAPGIISIEKLTETARVGKQIGLKVTTTPDITNLTVTNSEGKTVTLTVCVGKVQTLTNKGTVKIWLVHFPAVTAETAVYTVNGGDGISSEVTITTN